MIYVALLRGINVGGKNKVDMKQLKAALEGSGFQKVMTYINTGNILFEDTRDDTKQLTQLIELCIRQTFEFDIPVLLRTRNQLQNVINAIPDDWENNQEIKCDVMFLFDHIDDPKIIQSFKVRHELIAFLYVPGAVILKVSRSKLIKSQLSKLASQKVYQDMTIRNVNTVRKIQKLVQEYC